MGADLKNEEEYKNSSGETKMARYLGAKCKLCRAKMTKLMLKGERCTTLKCPIDKKDNMLRKGLPGKQPGQRLKKVSDYAIQLREKQKLKNLYGILEKQFRRYFEIAVAKKGKTGDNLLIILETRLDNALYRMRFASSRTQARQIILHGHVRVNGRKVNVPSYNLKVGDVVSIKEKSNKMKIILDSLKKYTTDGSSPWFTVDPDKCSGILNQIPKREDLVDLNNINEQLVVELYSK